MTTAPRSKQRRKLITDVAEDRRKAQASSIIRLARSLP
jgi:hypothetical protein